jgi:hypothetical protein
MNLEKSIQIYYDEQDRVLNGKGLYAQSKRNLYDPSLAGRMFRVIYKDGPKKEVVWLSPDPQNIQEHCLYYGDQGYESMMIGTSKGQDILDVLDEFHAFQERTGKF